MPSVQLAAERRVRDFPDQELATPFVARGPVVHVDAVRALARARTHLRRRSLPAGGSFESMVDGGLLTERGRLTEHGLRIARMLAVAPIRVRVHAATGTVPLVFEAHVHSGAVLILVTRSPAQLLAYPGSAGVGPFQSDPSEHIGLDLVSPGYLPVAIVNWAGLQPSEADPPQLTYTVPWAQVEAKFTGRAEELTPSSHDAPPAGASGGSMEASGDVASGSGAAQGGAAQGEAVQGEAVQGGAVQGGAAQGEAAQGEAADGAATGSEAAGGPADGDGDEGADGRGWIWQQHWVGWAISTEPATRNMTIVRAGEHSFRLTRPNQQDALLTWIPPEGVWLEVSSLVRDALAHEGPARMP